MTVSTPPQWKPADRKFQQSFMQTVP
ncbi:hypothetical protein [Treponema berlinense]